MLRSFPALEPCLTALDKFVKDTNALAALPKAAPPAAVVTPTPTALVPSLSEFEPQSQERQSQLSRVQPSLRQACYTTITQSASLIYKCLVSPVSSMHTDTSLGVNGIGRRPTKDQYSAQQLQQLVETYVMGCVSDSVQNWLQETAAADRFFSSRSQLLVRLYDGGQEVVGVPPQFCCDQQQAVKELTLMQYAKAPADKMRRFAAVVTAVEDAVENHLSASDSSDKEFATDDLIMVLVWVAAAASASSSFTSEYENQYQNQYLTADVQFCAQYHFPAVASEAYIITSRTEEEGRMDLCLCHFRVVENYLQVQAAAIFEKENVLEV